MFTFKWFVRAALLVVALGLLALVGSRATPAAAVAQDSVWYLPMVLNNYYGWNSQVWVQNNSSVEADISGAGYHSVPGVPPCIGLPIYSVPPHAWTKLPISCSSQVTLYGGVVQGVVHGTSTPSPIVAYVLDYIPNTAAGQNTDSTQEYYGVPTSAMTSQVYLPGILEGWGWVAYPVIQNAGTQPTVFTVSYYGQSCVDNSPVINPGSTWTFLPCVPQPTDTTAAHVTSTPPQPIAVVNSIGGPSGGQTSAFSMAGNSGFITTTVQNLAHAWNGLSTIIGCVNAGTSATYISVFYDNGIGESSTSPVQPGEFRAINQGTSSALPAGNQSVTATLSSSGQPINCYVAGLNGRTDDNLWAYTANNLAYPQSPSQGSPSGNTQYYGLVNANWYYNWGVSSGVPTTMEFIPMGWGDWECYWYDLSHPFPYGCPNPTPYQHSDPYVTPYPTPMPAPCDVSVPNQNHCPNTSTSQWLMGFNEANGRGNGMSCVGWANLSGSDTGKVTACSPQRAAQLWKKFQDTYRLRLLSPSTVAGSDIPAYLDDMRTAFQGYYNGANPRFDGLSTHCNFLTPFLGGENNCINTYIPPDLNRAVAWGVPEVWLTEFTVNTSWGGSCDATAAGTLHRFMDWVATQHLITRYQYAQDWTNFCDVIAGGALTTVGKAYWLYR